jgi:hypothetical protein
MLGAPVGGALYSKFGFRGPFIFGCLLALFDIVGRLLVIERKDALPWISPSQDVPAASAKGHDQDILLAPATDQEQATSPAPEPAKEGARGKAQLSEPKTRTDGLEHDEVTTGDLYDTPPAIISEVKPLSFLQVLAKLFTSPRALATTFNVFAIQYVKHLRPLILQLI